MDAQTILKMIEEVQPDDVAKLDEIDARVWCYLYSPKTPAEQLVWILDDDGKVIDETFQQEFWIEYGLKRHSRYCRSRDALKAIRPEGCHSYASAWAWTGKEGFGGKCMRYAAHWPDKDDDMVSPPLPTEELAELHAIIQAIAHDRTTTRREG